MLNDLQLRLLGCRRIHARGRGVSRKSDVDRRAFYLMSVSAVVPARSGSKRLPGKNVKPLGGKPIILWTLEACALAPSIDNIIFSTDSMEYWDLAREHLDTDKLILDHRTKEEAGDQIKIFDYLKQNPKKIRI